MGHKDCLFLLVDHFREVSECEFAGCHARFARVQIFPVTLVDNVLIDREGLEVEYDDIVIADVKNPNIRGGGRSNPPEGG